MKFKIKFLLIVTAVILIISTTGAVLADEARERVYLSPGGMAFGIKYFTKGALVIGITEVDTSEGLSSPAKEAGLKKRDIIVSIAGKKIENADDFVEIVNSNAANSTEIKYIRDNSEQTAIIKPVLDKNDNSYKLGLWVRDSTAGIGTITYVNKETSSFGGLGHGICDSETGMLLPFGKGVVVNVEITSVIKGVKNNPGELRGTFGAIKRGELYSNTEVGVFGKLKKTPDGISEELPVGFKEELETGKAYILSTLNGTNTEKFEIEIEKIYDNSGNTKNFLIKVTDPKLLEQTGGIVQGMSGSPIIKDGKLVGAVTHVLVDNSAKGYGIHLENMLEMSE